MSEFKPLPDFVELATWQEIIADPNDGKPLPVYTNQLAVNSKTGHVVVTVQTGEGKPGIYRDDIVLIVRSYNVAALIEGLSKIKQDPPAKWPFPIKDGK